MTNETAVSGLLMHGVTVASGVSEGWEPGNMGFDAERVRAWARGGSESDHC